MITEGFKIVLPIVLMLCDICADSLGTAHCPAARARAVSMFSNTAKISTFYQQTFSTSQY